jgi:hypothetical protein
VNEALRQDYLAAIGVDSYVPRFVLDGAAATPRCEISLADLESFNEESPGEPRFYHEADGASSQYDDSEYQQMAELGQAPSAPLPSAAELPKPKQSSRMASTLASLSLDEPSQTGRSKVTAQSRQPEQQTGPSAAASLNPEFSVDLVGTEIGLLMVLDTSAGPASPTEKRLLANIAQAVSRHHQLAKAPVFSSAKFQWPVVKTAGLAQDANAAREALQANIMAHAERQAAHCVIVFGESLHAYLNAAILQRAGIQILYAASAESMLADGSLKQPLWQNLRKVLFTL